RGSGHADPAKVRRNKLFHTHSSGGQPIVVMRFHGPNRSGGRFLKMKPAGSPMPIKGAMNGEAFLAHIKQCLALLCGGRTSSSSTPPPSRRVARVAEGSRGPGGLVTELRYLPQYSPDPSPIASGAPSPEDAAAQGDRAHSQGDAATRGSFT